MDSPISLASDAADRATQRPGRRTLGTDPTKRLSVMVAPRTSSPERASVDPARDGSQVRQRKPGLRVGIQAGDGPSQSAAHPSSASTSAARLQSIPRSTRRQVSSSLLSSSGRESWRYQTLPHHGQPASAAGERAPSSEDDLGLSAWAALAELRGPLSPQLSHAPDGPASSSTDRTARDSSYRFSNASQGASEAGDSSFGGFLPASLRVDRQSASSSSASSAAGLGMDIQVRHPPMCPDDAHLHQLVASPGSLAGAGPLASSTPTAGDGIGSPHNRSMNFSQYSIAELLEESEEVVDDDELQVASPTATERPLASVEDLGRFYLPSSPLLSPTAPFAPAAPAPPPAPPPPPPKLRRWQRPLLGFSRQQIDVLKCSIAYTLGSLFTFVPALNGLLLGTSSAHTIATVSVYYNPAKSLGTMLEADAFCLLVATVSALVSLAAVGTLKAADSIGTPWGRDVGDWTALFFWFGGTLSVLAWLKVRLGKQSFASATSMGLVILSNVIIKEGGLRKLAEVLLNVVIGTSISNLTCFAIFPHSATAKLQSDINSTLTSFSTLTTILSQTFLLDAPSPSSSPAQDLASAVAAHEKSFTSLKKTLSEAKSEFLGAQGERFEVVISSLTRLAQHLTGLRSGTGLQYELMAAAKDGRIVIDQQQPHDHGKVAWSPGERKEGSGFFEPAAGAAEGKLEREDAEDERLAQEANVFSEVREHVGPQLRSLTAACNASLLALRSTFNLSPAASSAGPPIDFARLTQELQSALVDFQVASSDSIADIYGGGVDDEAKSQSPKESVFLVFYFIFTFDEFARELLFLLNNMEDTLSEPPIEKPWWRIWRRIRRSPISRTHRGPRPRRTLRKRMSTLIPIDPSEFLKPTAFPRKSELAPNTATNPVGSMLALKPRLYHLLWEIIQRCRMNDIKYAVKVGMATALLAAPAFSDTWREKFLEYRMEWGLIAFFATMSPTEGATNAASVFRLLGTLAGALVAALVYSIFPENNIALPLIGFLFSLPCFWVIVTMPFYASAGRFVLLTYNLTALYCYNSRAIDTPVFEIAYRRFVSVSIGVVFTLIVSRAIWPYAARRELLAGLSDFYVDLSFLYTRLLATFSSSERVPPMTPTDGRALAAWDEEQSALTGDARSGASAADPLSASVREFMAMELHLQLSILTLKGLLEAATREPRLKGPFPKALFNAVLMSSQTILDRFHSIRCVVNRDEWDTSLYRSHVAPVNAERREMVGNVLLYFSTISAGFKLKTPMPPYLPPAERARQRLLRKAEALSLVHVPGKGSKHLLFFSYVLAMAGIIKELDYIGSVLQSAYGVVGGGVDEFEDLFFNPLISDISDSDDDDTMG